MSLIPQPSWHGRALEAWCGFSSFPRSALVLPVSQPFADSDEPSFPPESSESLYLYAHNAVRAAFHAQPLSWSDDLACKAQQWADGCQFKHTEGRMGPYGENIAAGTGNFTIPKAMRMFLQDMATFDPSNPIFSDFTQIIWQDTTRLGCASAQCSGIFDPGLGNATTYVCFYDPVGNVVGELFVRNNVNV